MRGQAGAASSVPNAQFVRADTNAFRYVGLTKTTNEAGVTFVRNEAVTGTPARGSAYYIEFETDSLSFEVLTKGIGRLSAHRFLVDGNYVSFDSIEYPADNQTYLTRVQFGTRQLRSIRIETYNMLFGGVNVESGSRVLAPAPTDRVRAVFFGASTIEGVPIDGYPYQSFSAQTARRVGWSDLYISGASGTGYTTGSGAAPKFADRFSQDVVPIRPDVIVISGGFNDPLSGLQREADLFFDLIQRTLPDTQVFVMGPVDPQQNGLPKRDAIRAALGQRTNFFFVDNIGDRWQTGTGNVGAPRGDGNNDQLTSADGIHLTQAGHAHFTDRLTADLRRIIQNF